MEILFRKTAAYDTEPKKSRYQYACELGLQQIEPEPICPHCFHIETKWALHSPNLRVFRSLPLNHRITFMSCASLTEVLFDVSAMCTQKEFESFGSTIIRKRFKEFFISDSLPAKRATLFDDVRSLLGQLQSFSIHQEQITVISHSFRMKIIEVYLKTAGAVEDHPSLIHEYILDDKKTFEFEKGFEHEI